MNTAVGFVILLAVLSRGMCLPARAGTPPAPPLLAAAYTPPADRAPIGLDADADSLPAQLVPAELEALNADKERLDGLFPGLLLTPHARAGESTDGKYRQPYHAACVVYRANRAVGGSAITGWARRFVVHAPDTDALPTARRVARLLLLLYGENAERLRIDHPLNQPTVDVWLTRQAGPGLPADVGGEQFKNQIYIYNILAERRPIEWVREIAHEYGHYILPGVSGFTAPEEWANGALGERLFLLWLQSDLRAGRLHPEEVPFASAEQLSDYINKQVTPLIRRIAHDGLNERQIARKDAAGMDAYTSLALYLDTVYSSKGLLDALAYTTSGQSGRQTQAPDFLRGALNALRDATELTLTPPLWTTASKSETFFVYLPRGTYHVTANGPGLSWKLPVDAKGIVREGRDSLFVTRADWRKLTITLPLSTAVPPRLTFQKRGVEVQ